MCVSCQRMGAATAAYKALKAPFLRQGTRMLAPRQRLRIGRTRGASRGVAAAAAVVVVVAGALPRPLAGHASDAKSRTIGRPVGDPLTCSRLAPSAEIRNTKQATVRGTLLPDTVVNRSCAEQGVPTGGQGSLDGVSGRRV